MIFVATKTSLPLWTQNLVLQGEQPGFTGVFSLTNRLLENPVINPVVYIQ